MPAQTAVVTASKLNVRIAPSAQSNPPLGSLPRGATVDVLGKQGGWYRIRNGSLEGFVSGDYLRVRMPTQNAGFLVDRADLKAVPIAPPAPELIAPLPASGAARAAAVTWNQYGGLLRALSAAIGVPTSAAVAVLCVESSGRGFVNGRMVIRFENHVFFQRWGKANRAAFDKCFCYHGGKPWQGHGFRQPPATAFTPCHNSGQDGEWKVFEYARGLSDDAAKSSISMGAPQIMGFNHAAIGYDSAGEMFDAFSKDIRAQIVGMFDFIRGSGSSSRMVQALERGEFEQFATYYNGAGKAAQYGAILRKHAEAFEQLKPNVS